MTRFRNWSIWIVLLISPLAWGLTPETLLKRTIPTASSLQEFSARSWNPFSEVKVGHKYRNSDLFTKGGSLKEERILDRDDLFRHELVLSVTPKGFRESTRHREFAESLKVYSQQTQSMVRSQHLKLAYELVIQAAKAKDERGLDQDSTDTLERIKKIVAIGGRQSELDARKLLKIKAELEKIKDEILELRSLRAPVLRRFNQLDLNLDELETTDIIEPAEILQRIAHASSKDANLSVETLTAKIETERRAVAHEIEKRNHLIDEVQLSVGQNSKEYLVRLEVSLVLPFLASADLKNQWDQVKLADTEARSERELQQEIPRSQEIIELLKGKISLYLEMNGTNRKAPAVMAYDPSFGMELHRLNMDRQRHRLKLLAEIRLLYIDFLFETKELIAQQDINLLSKSKRRI